MLLAQGLLFIFLTDRLAGSMPARSPRELAMQVASDVSATLARDPATDLAKYLPAHYGHVFQPIIIAMRDGRAVVNRDGMVSDELLVIMKRQAVANRLQRRRFGRGDGPDGPGAPPRPGPDGEGIAPPPGPPDGQGGFQPRQFRRPGDRPFP